VTTLIHSNKKFRAPIPAYCSFMNKGVWLTILHLQEPWRISHTSDSSYMLDHAARYKFYVCMYVCMISLKNNIRSQSNEGKC